MFELSKEITEVLLASSVFTDVMSERLAPVVSSVDETYPFTNYLIQQQSGQSKDGSAFSVSLLCYFENEKYQDCVMFLDQLKPVIEENYDWESSTVEFVESDQSFVGIINFNKL